MTSFSLTPPQKKYFETFGYLVLPGLLRDEIADITRAFEEVWARRGHKHEGATRSALVPFVDQHERLVELMDDPRIIGLAIGVAGEGFNYVSSDGNYYVGDTRWHCDSWHEDKVFAKIALYLDPVGRESGALRVIPGSHVINQYRCDLGNLVGTTEEVLGIHGREVPCAALESNPGDVVCFHHNCLHASYGGSKARRMFTIDVCSHYEPEREGELRDYMGIFAKKGLKTMWGPRVYEDPSAPRYPHVTQVRANEPSMQAVAEEVHAASAAVYGKSY